MQTRRRGPWSRLDGTAKIGRKTKLTADLQKRLLDAIAAGTSIRTACAAVGLHEATYFRWLERGAKGEEPYRDLCEALTRAKAQGTVSLVATVRSHANRDWRAAAFILERRYPKEWGRHDTSDVTSTQKLAAELERRLHKIREANAKGEK